MIGVKRIKSDKIKIKGTKQAFISLEISSCKFLIKTEEFLDL